MFGWVRLLLGVVLLFAAFLVLKTSDSLHKNSRYIVCIVLIIVLVTGTAFVPFENWFHTFRSPEAAYNYYLFGESTVKLVVQGKKSDLVIGNNHNSDVYLIIPKTDAGWKVGIGSYTRKIQQKIIGEIVVVVHQYKDTDDYFVTIFDTTGKTLEVQDSCSSNFVQTRYKNGLTGKTTTAYHTNISNIGNEYWLNVENHEPIFLK